MNRDWWASPTEAFIYNEFADALREGIADSASSQLDDLMTEDALVLAKLDASGSRADRREAGERSANLRPESSARLLAAHRPQGALARPARAGERHGQAALAARAGQRFAAAGVEPQVIACPVAAFIRGSRTLRMP